MKLKDSASLCCGSAGLTSGFTQFGIAWSVGPPALYYDGQPDDCAGVESCLQNWWSGATPILNDNCCVMLSSSSIDYGVGVCKRPACGTPRQGGLPLAGPPLAAISVTHQCTDSLKLN